MTSADHRDLLGGMLMLCTGVFIVVYAQRYDVGTLTNMGPGYFPMALGSLLSIFGLIVAVPAFFRAGEPIVINWRSLLLIVGSLVFYALTLRTLGLLLSTAMAVLISSAASNILTLRGRAILVICVVAVTYVVFILGLGMRLPLLPSIALADMMFAIELTFDTRHSFFPSTDGLLVENSFVTSGGHQYCWALRTSGGGV